MYVCASCFATGEKSTEKEIRVSGNLCNNNALWFMYCMHTKRHHLLRCFSCLSYIYLTAYGKSDGVVIQSSSSTVVSFTSGSSCAFLGHVTIKVCFVVIPTLCLCVFFKLWVYNVGY